MRLRLVSIAQGQIRIAVDRARELRLNTCVVLMRCGELGGLLSGNLGRKLLPSFKKIGILL